MLPMQTNRIFLVIAAFLHFRSSTLTWGWQALNKVEPSRCVLSGANMVCGLHGPKAFARSTPVFKVRDCRPFVTAGSVVGAD